MFDSLIGGQLSPLSFFLCTFTAMVLGLLSALVFSARERHSAAFLQSMALLPAEVALVIMMVNGNVGAGLAVAGAFTLMRFRSAPGSAKEISALFFAVALGLACGMGYLGFAALGFLMIAVYALCLSRFGFGRADMRMRLLKITVPEDLDYETAIGELLEQYAAEWELERVRSTNMGTLFELSYRLRLRDPAQLREFLDALRCRNGNLNVSFSREDEQEMQM